MPELPEVETIRRGLEDCLTKEKGGRILTVKVFSGKSFTGEPSKIMGAEVVGIRRKGKALIFDLSNRFSVICHLRMTGQLIWVGKERFAGGHPNDNFIADLPNGQTRVMIKFQKGTLFFNDQRKFGFMKVVPTLDVERDSFISSLGREPWKMTGADLYRKLQRHKNSPVKMVIMDQTVMSGLGNIYADEALYFAKIRPRRKAGLISEEEAERLVEGARVVMDKSLEAGGSTIRNYVKSDGTKGNYLDLFAEVYGREGEKCRRCGATIMKIKLGGRGTHYCPECQKE